MHSILWPSIMASAGVAAGVTLAIEYAAKPWLDSRKDRILDAHHDQRDALKKVKRACVLLSSAEPYVERDKETYDNEHYESLVFDFMKECKDLLLEALITARMPNKVADDWEALMSVTTAFATRFSSGEEIPSDSPQWQRVKNGIDGLENLLELLATSKVRVFHRHQLIKELKSFLAVVNTEP